MVQPFTLLHAAIHFRNWVTNTLAMGNLMLQLWRSSQAGCGYRLYVVTMVWERPRSSIGWRSLVLCLEWGLFITSSLVNPWLWFGLSFFFSLAVNCPEFGVSIYLACLPCALAWNFYCCLSGVLILVGWGGGVCVDLCCLLYICWALLERGAVLGYKQILTFREVLTEMLIL